MNKQQDNANNRDWAQAKALELLTRLAELTCPDTQAADVVTRELDSLLAAGAVTPAFVGNAALSLMPVSLACLRERIANEQDPIVRAELQLVLHARTEPTC